MNERVEAFILEAKERERLLREAADKSMGILCDSIRGFIYVSSRWKTATDEVIDIVPLGPATNMER